MVKKLSCHFEVERTFWLKPMTVNAPSNQAESTQRRHNPMYLTIENRHQLALFAVPQCESHSNEKKGWGVGIRIHFGRNAVSCEVGTSERAK